MAKKTHIMAILDRSGSMLGKETDVIGNFNAFLKEQQEVDGEATMTLVLFDHEYEIVYDKIDIQEAKPIDSSIYNVRGSTALYDAMGRLLTNMRKKKQAIVLVNTDGAENSSQEFDKGKIKALVDELEKKWEFIFVGADMDAAHAGGGIGVINNLSIPKTSEGITRAYAVMNSTTSAYRSGGKVASAQAFAAAVGDTSDATENV